MEFLSVADQLARQLVLLLYFVFTMAAFAVISIQAAESLPRLKRAAFLTINSLCCVMIKRDWAYWCNQRFVDLGRTVPKTIFLICGSAASLALAVCQNQIPFDSQIGIVFGALCCLLVYYISEAMSDSQMALPGKTIS